MNEQEKFLEDLVPTEDDVLNKPLTEEISSTEEETSEDDEMKAKNRRERRLLEKNQQLREEALTATARLQGIQEAQKLRGTTEEADYLKLVEKIYGTATPEAQEATELLKKALQGVHKAAKEEALKESKESFEQERNNETQAVKQEEESLEDMMDNLEDSHNADFSNQTVRKGFLTLLEKLSPKDAGGNIIEYADPETVYEIFKSNMEKSNSRAKELAGRSMFRGGNSKESNLQNDSTERFLKEHGII
jgi:hypothetical protein